VDFDTLKMNPMSVSSGIYSDWAGTLRQDGSALRVLVHIRQAADGTIEGTMDNLDVGRMKIPLSISAFANGVLRFHAWPVDGWYEGKIAGDGQRFDGRWRMAEDVSPLILERVQPSPADGIWHGVLTHQSLRLRLVFYIGAGRRDLRAAMKSCDQGNAMIPMSAGKLIGRTIILEADSIGARFEGSLAEDFTGIAGTWTQSGIGLTLNLKRLEHEEEPPARPQEPAKPFPYREREAGYRSHTGGVDLRGTLTLPEGDGPFPAVLLLAGSGALDRDETMNGHRPLLVLADYLTRRGIAVLRADKRGVGESGGELAQATIEDFTADAEAGFAFLTAQPEVDRGRIGLAGHSEGGLVASMAAARNRDVAFLVLMAAPGVSSWDLAGQQARRAAEIHGHDPDEADRRNRDVSALLRNEKDDATLRRKLDQMYAHRAEPERNATIESLMLPWQRHAAGLNPADYLSKVTCPVLALNGEHDILVEPRSNLAAIRQALESAANREFELVELPGLNHMFQTCEGSSGTEYGQIEETLSPVVLEKIAEWITK
jgi:pimeloyl-ACP methyl ester carboxylesterase